MLLSVGSLFPSFIIMTYNNITTIEIRQGYKMWIPCWRRNIENLPSVAYSRNIFDRLWLNNFWDTFGPNFLLWLLPIKHEMEAKGFYYARIPSFDVNDLKGISDSSSMEQNIDENKSKSSIKHYARSALSEYSGKKMSIEGKIFTIPVKQ